MGETQGEEKPSFLLVKKIITTKEPARGKLLHFIKEKEEKKGAASKIMG